MLPLLCALATLSPGQTVKRPPIQLQNVSQRDVVVAPFVHRGAKDVAIGKPVRLPAKSGLRPVPNLFGTVAKGQRYALKFTDVKGRQLGLLRIDGKMLQNGLRAGLIVAVHDVSVSVRLGSRRQRILLIP
ncbi:MAG: hypothetical protein ACO1SV_05700 [Fimbriimonas sp.]